MLKKRCGNYVIGDICIKFYSLSLSLSLFLCIGSTPTFLYFDLYLYSAYAAHYVYIYEYTYIFYCGFKTCIKLICNEELVWFRCKIILKLIEISFCGPGKIFVIRIMPVSWTSQAHVNSSP